MSEHFTPDRIAVLRAVCDTVVPSLERPEDPHGLWARAASDVGVDVALTDMLRAAPDEDQAGLGQLLDGLAAQGFTGASQLSREQLLRNMSMAGAAAADAIAQLVGGTLYLHYGLPDPATGQNPAWPALGYPGPVSAAPRREKPIRPVVPAAGEDELDGRRRHRRLGRRWRRHRRRAQRGRTGRDRPGGRRLPRRVGLSPARAARVPEPLLARRPRSRAPTATSRCRPGPRSAAGTTINWTNCLRTKPWVRQEWAAEHGLDGVDGPDFDAPPGRGAAAVIGDRRLQRPQRPHAAHARGGAGARLVVHGLRPQHRPGDLLAPRPPASWASATSPAPSRGR